MSALNPAVLPKHFKVFFSPLLLNERYWVITFVSWYICLVMFASGLGNFVFFSKMLILRTNMTEWKFFFSSSFFFFFEWLRYLSCFDFIFILKWLFSFEPFFYPTNLLWKLFNNILIGEISFIKNSCVSLQNNIEIKKKFHFHKKNDLHTKYMTEVEAIHWPFFLQ